MKNKLLICLIICFFMTGCFKKTELDELAIFSGAGFDKLPNDKLQLTLQVILHRELKVQGSSSNVPFNNIVTTGNSVVDATNKFSLQSGRRGIWSHAKAFVIGEELAKSGIYDLLDVFQRDSEIRERTYLFIAEGTTAKEVLDSKTTNLETIQAFNISDMVEEYAINGYTTPVDIHCYLDRESEELGANFIPCVKILSEQDTATKNSTAPSSPNKLELMDTAILKDNKLVGFFDDTQTQGLLFLCDKLDNTIINFQYPRKDQEVYVKITDSRTRIKPVYENGKLSKVEININSEAKIAQSNPLVDLSNPESIQELNVQCANEIKRIVQETIKQGQLLKADVFSIGKRVYRTNPTLWKKLKPDWDDVFAALKFEVNSTVKIQRTGIISSDKSGTE